MSVNDVVTSGTKPLGFLDYYATGHLDVDVAEKSHTLSSLPFNRFVLVSAMILEACTGLSCYLVVASAKPNSSKSNGSSAIRHGLCCPTGGYSGILSMSTSKRARTRCLLEKGTKVSRTVAPALISTQVPNSFEE
ncbi:unnamed protein product [Trifolium pratense]|uniref:Uncharacterized protein n=2 Tax=Trifolium pratense TaxID=57577 RepID=A0ACB0IL34_TRIPR|nr:unnamed protein product [Trifolium pratense]CAJ2633278.1 unnamed protein product [Trifolium pratense]